MDSENNHESSQEDSNGNGNGNEISNKASLASRDPDSVSKEELMEILQKMNKRVKSLAALRGQLMDRVKSAESDKSRLLTILTKEVLTDVDLEEASQQAAELNARNAAKKAESDENGEDDQVNHKMDEISMIQLAWRSADERNQLALQQIQNEYKVISMQCQAEVEKVKEAMEVEKNLEIEKIKVELLVSSAAGAEGIDVKEVIDQAVKSAVESCEANHKQEVDVLRAQVASFENSGTAPTVQLGEVERAKAEMSSMSEQLEQSEIDHATQVQVIAASHEEYVKKVQEDAAKEKAAALSKLKELVKAKMISLKASCEEKIKVAESSSGGINQSALEQVKNSHAEEIEKLKNEHAIAIGEKGEDEFATTKAREELQELHSKALDGIRQELNQIKESELHQVNERANAEIEQMRIDADQRIKDAIEKLEMSGDASENEKLVAVQEEFEQKTSEMQSLHQNEISNLRSELTSSTEKIEEVEATHKNQVGDLASEHEEELHKAKSDAVEQKNEFKEQVKEKMLQMKSSYEAKTASVNEERDAERDNLLEELRQSHANELEALIKDHTSVLEQMSVNGNEKVAGLHSDELAKVQKELSDTHENAIQTLRNELEKESKEEIQKAASEAAGTLEKLRVDADERVQDAYQKCKAAASLTENEDLAKAQKDYETKLVGMQSFHQEELNKVMAEAASINDRFQEIGQSHESQIQVIQSQHQESLAKSRNDAAGDMDAMRQNIENEISENYEAKIESMVVEMESAREEAIDTLEKSHAQQIIRLQGEHSASLEQLSAASAEDIAASHVADLQRAESELKSSHEALMQNLRNELEEIHASKAAEEARKICTESEEKMKDALKEGEEKASASESKKIIALREEYEMKLANMGSSHKQELNTIGDEAKSFSDKLTDMQESHSKQLETIQSQHEESIQMIESEAELDKSASLNEWKEKAKEKMAEMEKMYETKIANGAVDLETKHNEAIQETEQKYAMEFEALKIAHANSIQESVVKTNEDATTKSLKEFSRVKKDLQQAHEGALDAIKLTFTKQHELQEQENSERFSAEIEHLRLEAADKEKEAFQKGSEIACESESEKLATAEEQYESKLTKLRSSHDEELERTRSETLSLSKRIEGIEIANIAGMEEAKFQFDESTKQMKAGFLEEKACALDQLRSELDLANEGQVSTLMEDISKLEDNSKVKLAAVMEDKEENETRLLKSIEDAAHSSDTYLLEEQQKFQILTDESQKEYASNNAHMAAALDEAQSLVNKLQNALEREHSEIKLLKSNIEVLSASAQGGETDHKNKIDELMSKQKLEFEEVSKSHKNRHSEDMAIMKEKTDSLESEVEEKMQETAIAKKTIMELSIAIEEGSKSQDQLALKCSQLVSTIEEKGKAIESLQNSLAEINDEHSNSIQSLRREYEETQTARDDALAMLDVQQSELVSADERYSAEIEQMKASNQDESQQIVQLTQELSFSNKEVERLTEEMEHSQNQISTAEEKIDELESALQGLEAEKLSNSGNNETIQSKLFVACEEIDNLQSSAAVMETSLHDIRQERDALNVQLEELSHKENQFLESHQKEISEISNSHESVSALALSKLQAELEGSQANAANTICKLEEDLTTTRKSIENLISSHESELKNIVEVNVATMAEARENSEMSKENMSSMIDGKEREIEELKSEYDTRNEKLEGQKSKALELARKVKEAAQIKLNNAAKGKEDMIQQHKLTIAKLNDEKNAEADNDSSQEQSTMQAHQMEINELQSTHKAKVLELNSRITALEQSMEEERNQLLQKIASVEQSMEEERNQLLQKIASVEKHVIDAGDVESERFRIAEGIKAAYEERIENLNTEHDSKKREILEKLKVKFNEKLQSAIKDHESTKVILKETMAQQTDELKKHFEEKLNKKQEEIESTKEKMKVEKASLEQKLSTSHEQITAVQEGKDSLQTQLSAQMVSAATLTNQLDATKKDLENSITNSEATTSSLLAEQEKMSSEQQELNDRISAFQQELGTKNNKLEELTGKMTAFQEFLNTISTDKKKIEGKLEAALKQVAKLDATEVELEKSREELNRFKLESSQNSALLSRLKADQEAGEKTHGQRTALVGMLETQLSELNDTYSETQAKLEAAIYDISQKDDDLNVAREEVDQLTKDLMDANTQTVASKKAALAQKAQSSADNDMHKKAKLAESLQKEVQTLQQLMAKKSSAAQRLLQQRETDCQELKKRIKSLQQELDKGSLSDRRIFELAAQQSNRESVASSEISIRNQMVERLTDKLEQNDSELALTEYTKKQIEIQVEELCRIHRREDINLDYLKSTIVQFLSKPPGSSERGALLPVMATLLQFDSEDYKLIEQGKTKVSWFGSVLPTIINAPVPEATTLAQSSGDIQAAPLLEQPSSSAEITISSQPPKNSADRTYGTSLQF